VPVVPRGLDIYISTYIQRGMVRRSAKHRENPKMIGRISYGSILDDLDIAPGKLASFKLPTELHAKVIKVASQYSQAELQKLLNESQPRVSDFLRGKITKFSLETLVEYADRLGMHPQIKTEVPRKPRERFA
jgi:predicted XRE-type DNA-binding protein